MFGKKKNKEKRTSFITITRGRPRCKPRHSLRSDLDAGTVGTGTTINEWLASWGESAPQNTAYTSFRSRLIG